MTAPTPPADGRMPADTEPVGYAPLVDPLPAPFGDRPRRSFGSMETLCGTGLSSWGDDEMAVCLTDKKVQLQLDPDCPVVIGRQDVGIPPYLDPSYRSTRIVPGTGQSVVQSLDQGRDTGVSRAHFMLRGCARGIVLTNGVPRLGGGIRPPVNNTWLVFPVHRAMNSGEEFLIEHGAAATIFLVNGTTVKICAE